MRCEAEFTQPKPAAIPKRVMVVEGGPAGIAAATYDGALIALLPKAWRKWKEGKDYFALR